MDESIPALRGRLAEIAAEFADCEPRERLEILRDYADAAPELPQRFHAARDAGVGRVHECMTPVFLWVELDDGRVRIYGEAAPEAPTVQGFVALLIDALDNQPLADVLATPLDLVQRLGLVEALGMQRMHGLHGILRRIVGQVRQLASGS